MKQRGRKSAAAGLTVVEKSPDQRPAPPEHLTAEQAEIWRSVVAAKSADFFSRESHEILAAYCRHTVTARHLAAHVDAAMDGTDVAHLGRLLAMHEAESRTILAVARSLRLTHQSRYRPDSAAARQSGAGPRPWE